MRERVPRSHGAPGATEEKWTCKLTIPDAHERTIYSISWTEAYDPGSNPDSEIGWLASVGGDGATKVWRVRVRHSGLLCFVFRPFLRPSNAYHLVFAISQAKSSPDDAPVRHDLLASLQNTHGDADINSVSWCPREGFRNLLATAGDDGTVQIWRIIPS